MKTTNETKHIYTLLAGRRIDRDGKPFVTIHRIERLDGAEYVSPTDADAFTRRTVELHNEAPDLARQLAECREQVKELRELLDRSEFAFRDLNAMPLLRKQIAAALSRTEGGEKDAAQPWKCPVCRRVNVATTNHCRQCLRKRGICDHGWTGRAVSKTTGLTVRICYHCNREFATIAEEDRSREEAREAML